MPDTEQQAAAERSIDLDEARAARAEAQADPVTVKFAGSTFTLPPEMPADFALLSASGEIRSAIGALFGEQAEEFFAKRPSMADLTELTEAAARIYGVTSGKP